LAEKFKLVFVDNIVCILEVAVLQYVTGEGKGKAGRER